jgi:hypothetical protein
MRWAGHVAHIEGNKNAYRVLVGRAEGMGPLGRLKHSWKGNIKVDLTEIGWSVVN